jgi:hypothetical protein
VAVEWELAGRPLMAAAARLGAAVTGRGRGASAVGKVERRIDGEGGRARGGEGGAGGRECRRRRGERRGRGQRKKKPRQGGPTCRWQRERERREAAGWACLGQNRGGPRAGLGCRLV